MQKAVMLNLSIALLLRESRSTLKQPLQRRDPEVTTRENGLSYFFLQVDF